MFEACEAALGLLRSVFCGLFCSCFGCCCGAEADDDVIQEPPIERTGKRPPQDLKAYQWPRFFSAPAGPDAGTEALLARRQTHTHDGAEGQRTPTADDLNRQYESLATIPAPPGALPAATADALAPSFRPPLPPLAAGDAAALPLPQRRPSPRSMLEGSGGGGGGSGGGRDAEAAAVLLKDSQVQKQQQRAARSPGVASSPSGSAAARPPRQRGSGAMSSGGGGGGSGSFVTCNSHESFVTCTAASAAYAGNEHDLEGFEDALTFGPSPPSSPPPRIESRTPSPLAPPPAQARRSCGGGAAAGPMLVA
ncbi:hypothetical protein JKP88DRAFT_244773 [Tribonema minus]|uniref:Uncharacterized protein n=1 Tax=Tribonema minus TaxID=303371 RepID=A0A835YZB6_9STRA|nr:hypothetical protein JKP88DRAFT_244773 [Tribonema minus]